MAYPPPVPPATRTNATVMATNHPADHNAISAALTEILNHMATLETSLYPIGTIAISGADIPPGNHELCRGQEVSKTQYPEVFALIGTKFGPGTASTFTMPDFRGRYPIGFNIGGTYFGAGIGEKYGSPDVTGLLAHSHGLGGHWHGTPDHAHGISFKSGLDDTNHIHFPDSGGQFLMNGPGSGGDAFVKTDTIGPHSYALGMPAGRSAQHAHDINGATQNAGAGLATGGPSGGSDNAGGNVTNANLPPSLSVNYIMRMH